MTKKNTEQKWRCCANALIKSYEKSPHMTWLYLKSLSGDPNLDPIQKLAIKGFSSSGTAMSCGGSFRSSWWQHSYSAFSFQVILPKNYCFNKQFGPKQINPRHPRGTPWSLPYSWKSEVLDLAQMVLTIRKQHKMTSFIIPNNYCFNKLAQKSISDVPGT